MAERLAASTEDCFRVLREGILTGQYRPGTRLPPERRLAEQLGVHRVTLRAAIGQLAALGLVEVRQGSGTVVTDYRERGGLMLLAELAANAGPDQLLVICRDLLELRRRVAIMLFEKIADQGGLKDRSDFDHAVGDFRRAIGDDAGTDDLALADLAVVAALCRGGGSPVLQLALNPIGQVVVRVASLRAALYATPKTNLTGYEVLSHWLHDPVRTALVPMEALLASHDEQTLDRLERVLHRSRSF